MKEGYDLMLQNKFSDGNQIEIIIFRLMLWLESCYICMLIVTTVIMVISSCKKIWYCIDVEYRIWVTLGCKMFAQGKKQLETRAIIKISTQPC